MSGLLRCSQIDLRDRDHGTTQAQQSGNIDVLDRLRLDAFIGRHDQQHGIHSGGAGNHGAHETFMAGHVDQIDVCVRRNVQMRKAERDGNSALFLLDKAIGILAGQCPHQRGLAVIDMTDHTKHELRHASAVPGT